MNKQNIIIRDGFIFEIFPINDEISLELYIGIAELPLSKIITTPSLMNIADKQHGFKMGKMSVGIITNSLFGKYEI